MLGYFQPKLAPSALQSTVPSSIALERIKAGFAGESLKSVLTVFFASDPGRGGQRIVGWFRSSTVYRHAQESSQKARQRFSYYIEASEGNEVLVPKDLRDFILPGGVGGAGTANVCYVSGTRRRAKGEFAVDRRGVRLYQLVCIPRRRDIHLKSGIRTVRVGLLNHLNFIRPDAASRMID